MTRMRACASSCARAHSHALTHMRVARGRSHARAHNPMPHTGARTSTHAHIRTRTIDIRTPNVHVCSQGYPLRVRVRSDQHAPVGCAARRDAPTALAARAALF